MADSSTPSAQASTPHVDRRRLLGTIAGGALLAGLHLPAARAQQATPPPEQLTQLKALSQTLCGGGVFDDGRTAQLAALIAGDPSLSTGLEELMQDSAAIPAPENRSQAAQGAAQEILLYWYTGTFKGEPVEDHAAIYTQVLAWQAMYTPAWTTCKLYGGWSDPPVVTPQQPENI